MLKLDTSLVEQVGFNPYYNIIPEGKYIDLASNNYLGLAAHDSVKQSAIDAILKYGASMCGTPVATGYIDLFQKLERRLSGFVGLPETIIFPSCYQANNGLFSAIAAPGDLIIVDRDAHSSLIQGIKAVGCKIVPFLHNDMDHLERILLRSKGYKQTFIVTESVFSTEGSIAPVAEIEKLCVKYNATAVVDDSHGIGVLGKRGGGVLAHFGIKDFTGIYTASLGKAMANNGGMISGRHEIISYLRYYCPQLVYSTAITPATLGGIDGALDVIDNDFPRLHSRMWEYKHMINQAFPTIPKSEAPINSIPTGVAYDTLLMSKKLFERGILSTPFIEPSVPKHQGIVRLIAGAGLTQAQVKTAINAIGECL